jgi:predicted nucleotidyltransferase
MHTHLPFDAKALERLCQRHRIRTLSLFGSRLKGTARPDSDVDLLVEFLPDARPTLLDMAEIELELSELLDGATVDLRTAQDLSRYFRDEVVKEAELQYEA